ncbi:hypothetical protein ACLKA6_013714 [Drosophila palustris]
MKWTWTYLAVLCLTFCICHCSSVQNENDRRRLFDELEKFNNSTWKYIEDYKKDLSSLRVTNILQDLIDRNITGHQTFKNSCPDRDGIFQIKVAGLEPFSVQCDSKTAGPGWMVILKRFDGSTNFYRDWTQYQKGFGDLSSEYFIGLDRLHAITYDKPHELYIFLEDFEGSSRFARYDEFLIGSVETFYKLEKLGNYFGTAGDSLSYSANMRFQTYDNNGNNDCAVIRLSAGWFNRCTRNNIFGVYAKGNYEDNFDYKGIWWQEWRGDMYSLKTVQMMIRPKCYCSKN